jgi:hypothetical protein
VTRFSFSTKLHRFELFNILVNMKSFIVISLTIFYWLSCYVHSSGGDLCHCVCCTLPPIPCTPVNQTPLNVTHCSLCTPALCTTNYPTQCPGTNSSIENACGSDSTNEPSTNITTKGPPGSTTTKSTGVSITDSTIKYLLVGSVALASFLGTHN